jgi:hypothetical protein
MFPELIGQIKVKIPVANTVKLIGIFQAAIPICPGDFGRCTRLDQRLFFKVASDQAHTTLQKSRQ